MRLVLKELFCRFQVPRELSEETRIVIIDHKYAKKKEKTRRCEVVLQFRSNDKWVNAHSRVGMCMLLSCRFQFPRELSEETRIVVIDHKYAKKKEKTRRCEVVLQFRSNDKWVNAHSRVGMCMWGANMDISLLISVGRPLTTWRNIVRRRKPRPQAFETSCKKKRTYED
jgi:hypothetical protein